MEMNRKTLPAGSAAVSETSAERTGAALENVWVYAKDKGHEEKPLLKGISCRIAPGSITLIAGASGSGKTTLLQTLAGLLQPGRGTVAYGPQSLWEDDGRLQAMHREIGIVFQYPERQLFADSIEKEFRYSLRPYRLSKSDQAKRIDRALAQMGLTREILTESFLTLSEGQKRKAALATALATEPKWLLLDEPTAGIDPQGIGPLLRCLEEQKRNSGGGAIVVSHDLDTFLPLADRVLILHNGTLAAEGTPQELLANPGLWLETEVGLPSALQLAVQLGKAGIEIDRVEGVPLTAEAMAGRLLGLKEEEQEEGGSFSCSDSTGPAAAATSYGEGNAPGSSAAPAAAGLATGAAERASSSAAGIVRELHPIAKWIVYVLLTAAVLMQHSWIGIGAAGLLTGGLILLSGVSYRSLLRPAKPFLYFIAISTLVSGITVVFPPDSWRPERIYFSVGPASQTLGLLLRFLLVMLLGILLAVTTGVKRMQLALEQALSFLERLRVPTAPFTFAATLLMRFLPRLLQEMDRMAIIVQARGKTQMKKRALRLREIPVFLIPFLLSMMKYAEDLSLLLEARGYQLKRLRREGRTRLPWTRREHISIAAGALLFAALYIIKDGS